MKALHLSEYPLLELSLHLLALLVCSGLAMEGHKSTKVKLWLLQKLHLADMDLCVALVPMAANGPQSR